MIGAGYATVIAIAGIMYLLAPRDAVEAISLKEMAPDLFPDED